MKEKWMNERMDKGYSFKYIKGPHGLNIKVVCIETKEEFILEYTDEEYYKFASERLWSLLDDVDTYSDMFKPADEKGYKVFYEATMKRVEQRHKYLTSDGYDLFIPDYTTPKSKVVEEANVSPSTLITGGGNEQT